MPRSPVILALLAGLLLVLASPFASAAMAADEEDDQACTPGWYGAYGVGFPYWGTAALPVPVAAPVPAPSQWACRSPCR